MKKQIMKKKKIFERWRYEKFKFKSKKHKELVQDSIFEIYEYATLSELLECYKKMKLKINSFELVEIDNKVNSIRNKLYHHDNILIEDKPKVNNQIDENRLKKFKNILNKEELNYIKINFTYNTTRLLCEMIMSVNFFLSRDECVEKRKKIVFKEARDNLMESKRYYEKLDQKEWINIVFSILEKQINYIK